MRLINRIKERWVARRQRREHAQVSVEHQVVRERTRAERAEAIPEGSVMRTPPAVGPPGHRERWFARTYQAAARRLEANGDVEGARHARIKEERMWAASRRAVAGYREANEPRHFRRLRALLRLRQDAA